MARYRVVGLDNKLREPRPPPLASSCLITVDVHELCQVHLEFWEPGILRRKQGHSIDEAALQALRSQYHLAVEQGGDPTPGHPHRHTAVFNDSTFTAACLTLIQQGIRAQFLILVEDGECSLAISTSRPAEHILTEFFPEIEPMGRMAYAGAASGRHHNPRVLKTLTLPRLPGIGGAVIEVLPVSPPITAQDAMDLGVSISPVSGGPAAPYRIRRSDLMKGTIIAGTTGSGKTNTSLRIIDSVLPQSWALIFDVKKEYRSLHRTHNAQVFSFRGANLLTHNLLKPAGSPERWVKEFPSILAEVIYRDNPAAGSKDVVMEEMDRLYRQRGVYDGSPDYPHAGHLIEALEARSNQASHREKGWIDSALRVLRALRVGSTRSAFFVREGLALERLMRGAAVVELDGIGDPDASALLVSVLLQKIRIRLMEEPPSQSLRGLIVVEEAQHMLAQGREATSVIATTCREIRSSGVGLVMVTQMPSDFSRHAMANANTIIAHRLVHPQDATAVGRMMRLSQDEAGMIHSLPVGRAVIWSDGASMVAIPEMERPFVRDRDLPAVRVEREEIAQSYAMRGGVRKRADRMDAATRQVFEAVAESKANYPTGIRQALPGISGQVQNALSALLGQGFIAYTPANRRAKGRASGRPRTTYFLTPSGEEAYRERHGRYADRRGMKTAPHARAVENVVTELGVDRITDRRFDIVCRIEGREVAVEVETGANNNRQILGNLTDSIDRQGDAWFVALDQRTANRILQVAARHAFDTRTGLTVRIALIDDLPDWEEYAVTPRTPTP